MPCPEAPTSAPPPPDASPDAAPGRPAWQRLWPIGLILAVLALAYALGLHRLLSFEALAAHRASLGGFVAAQPLAAALAYLAAYVAVVAFSLPGGAVMTLAGGFLFGPWLGAGLAVAGATIGACLLFLAARHALAEVLERRAGPLLGRVREELRRGGFWYLLSLRLLPVVPFWLVNLAPALAGMALSPYAAATFLGIIPATVVYAGIGAGLGQVFEAGGRPDLSVVFSPGILLPLLGLAALSLLGAWWRRRQQPG
ncbi:TVP38/TMEM64 family protein [Siccirubricoccus sp. G192]|uniref:TVP38/TMEM64 family protein n=1 Tax=Siccirubricoccus sp. G192 TaxID=2849651 RepID=UPI001C2C860E|nr:TVP38/TMEM64 family protein [Siccirubricoccus sp. G192]MBV1799059.1 TVP38/TMEM64 family protein [Siccirubricoccus sp. G192]